ncbi:MAG: TolC family protein [Bacteroidales bacterium]|nr:TolC family protein [Bacteroidales bacterium]
MTKLTTKAGSILLMFCILTACTLPTAHAQDSIHVDLKKTIEIALVGSPTIRIADRTIESKKYYKKEQIAALFPDVSLSAAYQRTLKKQKMAMEMGGNLMEIEVGMYNNYSASASLSLPLVVPALWNNVKLSQQDVELAIESARSSRIATINEVKKAYYSLLLAKESYRVLKLNYDNAAYNNKTVTDKYNQGMASEFDKVRADVNLKTQEPNLSSAKRAIDLATMMLKVIIGVDINEPMIFDGSLADYEDEVINYQSNNIENLSLSNNSDLKQLQLNQEKLETSMKLIKSSSCPNLVLSGSYQYMTMNNDFDFANYHWFPYSVVGLSLRVPITSWAATSFQIKEMKLSMANLQDQKEYVENNLRVSVKNSVANINNAVDELASNKETMLQAEKAYDIVQKQYEVGMATWLDLNSAELTMTQARLLYSQSIYNYLTARSELDAVLGSNEIR